MTKKIKIFSAYQDIAAIEADINNWLSKNPDIRIVDVVQSQTVVPPQRWNLVISMLYETD